MTKNSNHQLSIEWIGLLYIIVASSLCYLLPIPEIIKSLLALPAFFIIPVAIGKSASIPLKIISSVDLKLDAISKYIIYWCIGIIALVIIAYFLNYIWFFDSKIYIILIIILMIISILHNEKQYHSEPSFNLSNNRVAVLLSMLIGTTAFLFVTTFSPYPYEAGGDSLTHNYMSMLLLKDNFIYFQSPYLNSLSILTSIIIQIFNISNEPYVLWWLSRLILHIAYAIGLYLFSYDLSGKKNISLIAVIIGIFVVHHNSGLIYLNDFAPKSIITVLFPYLLFFIHKMTFIYDKIGYKLKDTFCGITIISVLLFIMYGILQHTYNTKSISSFVDSIGIVLAIYFILILFGMKYLVKNAHNRAYIFVIFVVFSSLLIIHTAMGFVASVLLILYLTAIVIFKRYEKFALPAMYFILVIACLEIVLQLTGFFTFNESLFKLYDVINPGIDGFQNMIGIVGNELYSLMSIYLFIIGCIIALIKKHKSYHPLLFLVAIIGILIFAPISSVFRLIIFLNPILAFFAAYGLNKLYNLFCIKNDKLKQHAFMGLILIVLILSVIGNYTNEMDIVISEHGVFSYVIHETVYSSGFELKNVTRDDTFVIFYRPSSETRWIGLFALRPFYIPFGGSPPTIKEFFEEPSAEISYRNIRNFYGNGKIKTEYYLSGVSPYQYDQRHERIRHIAEKRRNGSLAIFVTKGDLNLLSEESINKFYNGTYFTLLCEDEVHGYKIFGVNPEPGIPFER